MFHTVVLVIRSSETFLCLTDLYRGVQPCQFVWKLGRSDRHRYCLTATLSLSRHTVVRHLVWLAVEVQIEAVSSGAARDGSWHATGAKPNKASGCSRSQSVGIAALFNTS